jgi:hypothetical protein
MSGPAMTAIQAQCISAKQLQCHQNFHLIRSYKVVILKELIESFFNEDYMI